MTTCTNCKSVLKQGFPGVNGIFCRKKCLCESEGHRQGKSAKNSCSRCHPPDQKSEEE